MLQELAPIIAKEHPFMLWVIHRDTEKRKGKIKVDVIVFVKGQMMPTKQYIYITRKDYRLSDGKKIMYRHKEHVQTEIYIGEKYTEHIQNNFKGKIKDKETEREQLIRKYKSKENMIITQEVKNKRLNRLQTNIVKLYQEGLVDKYQVNKGTGEIRVIFKNTHEKIPHHYIFGVNYIFVVQRTNRGKVEKLLTEFTGRDKSVWQVRNNMERYKLGNAFNSVLGAYDLRMKQLA